MVFVIACHPIGMAARTVAIGVTPVETILHALRSPGLREDYVEIIDAHALSLSIVLCRRAATPIEAWSELAKLAAGVPAEGVQMATVGETECMGLATADRDNPLVCEGLHLHGAGLVRLLIGVLRKVPDVIKAKLSIGCFTPGIDMAIS